MLEQLQKLFDEMGNNDIVSLEGLCIADVSRLLALVKADEAHKFALYENLQVCIEKIRSQAQG